MFEIFTNQISSNLAKGFELRALNLLIESEYDHPYLSEFREREHEEHLCDHDFRLTVNYLEKLSNDVPEDNPSFKSEIDLEISRLEQFGNLLKKCRGAKKLTQKEMAKRLDIAQSTYSRMERGKVWPHLGDLTILYRSFWPTTGMALPAFMGAGGYEPKKMSK